MFTAVCRIIIALIAVVGAACSKPNVINPADASRVRKIDATVEQIRKAYTAKDLAPFQALFMPIESLRRMEAEIQRDYTVFDRIALDVSIDRVMVDGADIAVYFHWQGQWQMRDQDQPQRERGHAILRLVGHENLSLTAMDGDVPFGMAGRRIQNERPQRGR